MNIQRKVVKGALVAVISLLVIGIGTIGWVLENNSWGLTLGAITKQSLPRQQELGKEFPEKFMIDTKNYGEIQGKSQCAGFSSAYVLRSLGEEATGQRCYEQFDQQFKLSSGYVIPQGIVELFAQYGYEIKLYRGEEEHLKANVALDKPIIVLIGDGGRWQHYVTVVGYDQENVYLYDTNKKSTGEAYTRVMSWVEFNEQWKNGIPLFENIYFIVSN